MCQFYFINNSARWLSMKCMDSDSWEKSHLLLEDESELLLARKYCKDLILAENLTAPLISYIDANHKDACLIRVENFINNFKQVTKIDLQERCLDLVKDKFGEDAVLFKDKINFRYPGADGYAPHQDGAAGWDKFASKFITVAVAIEDSTVETGGFSFPSGPSPGCFYPNTNGMLSDVFFESLKPKSIEISAGDGIIFDSFLPHRTYKNISNKIIPHLILTFNRLAEGDHLKDYYSQKVTSMVPSSQGYEFRLFEFSTSNNDESLS